MELDPGMKTREERSQFRDFLAVTSPNEDAMTMEGKEEKDEFVLRIDSWTHWKNHITCHKRAMSQIGETPTRDVLNIGAILTGAAMLYLGSRHIPGYEISRNLIKHIAVKFGMDVPSQYPSGTQWRSDAKRGRLPNL
jgi:hypothetical protein